MQFIDQFFLVFLSQYKIKIYTCDNLGLRVMVFNETFNNVSVNYTMAVSFIGGGNWEYLEKTTDLPQVTWQTLSHNVVSSTLVVIGTDCIGSCKSKYHKITTMTSLWIGIKLNWNFKYFMCKVTWWATKMVNCSQINTTPFNCSYNILNDKTVFVHVVGVWRSAF